MNSLDELKNYFQNGFDALESSLEFPWNNNSKTNEDSDDRNLATEDKRPEKDFEPPCKRFKKNQDFAAKSTLDEFNNALKSKIEKYFYYCGKCKIGFMKRSYVKRHIN